jgi:transcriptional regulator of heat shock response
MREQLRADQPQRVIANAAHLLSNWSSFVGVVTAPRKPSVFRHIEFLRLGDKRVLVIMVSPDGDVQNRVIFTQQDFSQGQLIEATNYLNEHYGGLTLEEVREKLKTEVEQLRGEITGLMQAAVDAGSEAMAQSQEDVVVSGERNLLSVQDFSDMGSLRRLFDLFEQKTQLMRLLDVSSRAEGVRIYIGGESGVVPVCTFRPALLVTVTAAPAGSLLTVTVCVLPLKMLAQPLSSTATAAAAIVFFIMVTLLGPSLDARDGNQMWRSRAAGIALCSPFRV